MRDRPCDTAYTLQEMVVPEVGETSHREDQEEGDVLGVMKGTLCQDGIESGEATDRHEDETKAFREEAVGSFSDFLYFCIAFDNTGDEEKNDELQDDKRHEDTVEESDEIEHTEKRRFGHRK